MQNKASYRFETVIVDEKGRETVIQDTGPIRVTVSLPFWIESMRLRIASMTVRDGRAAMMDRASRN